MRYLNFEIRNFKGIKHLQLDLSKSPRSQVHMLIGLNESGKTTVLEAIDRFRYREDIDVLGGPGYQRQAMHELIPIGERANFNGTISITAYVGLDNADKEKIRTAVESEHKIILVSDLPDSFKIIQSYEFASSKLRPVQPPTIWHLVPRAKTPTSKNVMALQGKDWENFSDVVQRVLPRVAYFPNFLFEFPDKVFLENAPTEKSKHVFFRGVIQDVLNAMGGDITIGEHILPRFKSGKEWDKKILDSILLKMGAHITKTVFAAWDKIFKQPAGAKEIVVRIGADKDPKPRRTRAKSASPDAETEPATSLPAKSRCFLELRLKEGNTYYDISERSLGFRWFFTYLFLRGLRSGGTRNVLFLLDEPASNLHPSAQAQLLNTFESLPEECSLSTPHIAII